MLVFGATDPEEVGVGPADDLDAAGALAARGHLGFGDPLAEKGLRQLEREGELADPFGADKEESMRQATAEHRPTDRLDHPVMASER